MTDLTLFQIEKTSEDIRKTVLTNIVKMLTERKLLAKDNLAANIEKVLSMQSDDMTYVIQLDEKNKTFAVKIVFQKITAINKSYGISEFLAYYKSGPKLIVVKDISKKAIQYILNNFSNTEIFLEKELMINVVDHVLIPKHEVLAKEDVDVFFETYNCKKRNMPKILSTDPIAKYFNMKVGDICRITRPSDTSGFVPTYRLVVKGSLSKS
jgi:DNA-directed RNA polymerase I, II, and III subunit RPABC1